MRASPTWHKLSWLAEFIASMPHYRRNTIATAQLAIAAREHLFAWAEAERIPFDLRRQGILHIYRDRKGFEHAGTVSTLLAEGGLARRAVTPEEMRAIEPTLAGRYYGGWFTESDSTGDIHKFTHGLAAAAQRHGAQIHCGQRVVALKADADGAAVQVDPGDGAIESQRFGAVIVCAGTASRDFAAMLGDRVNVYPVKGYSITVNLRDAASRRAAPQVSLLDDETKLVTSRLTSDAGGEGRLGGGLGEDRLRVAGTAEFNGHNRDILAERVKPLVDWVQRCFPGVDTRSVVPWAGLRPMMPDLMPRVGRGRRPGVYYNTGHGHLGWTLSAATADSIAQLVEHDRRG